MSSTLEADAVIVGAGIQGATLAFEMARRGRRAIVIERGEPGAGNTEASLGLLHGGLRYLQKVDLPRWWRSKREQAWFMRELPEYVRALPCVMPLYRGTPRSPALFRAAFGIDRCGLPFAPSLRRLPAGRLLMEAAVQPGYPLVRACLIGGAHWHELLLASPKAAVQRLLTLAAIHAGASLVHGDAIELLTRRDGVAGLGVDTGQGSVELRAPVVVLCAGATTYALAQRFDRPERRLSSAMLAVNLLLDLPVPHGVALGLSPVPGRGRSLFLREDGGRLLAGTWYLPAQNTSADRRSIDVPASLIDGALDDLAKCLPGLVVDSHRLLDVRAGLLPDTDGTGRVLRERDVLHDHGAAGGPRGLWSVLGVKLTTARALSARAATRIWPHARSETRPIASAAVGPADTRA
ncbi:MAG: FAD-dependent oxidoreductase [Burkholderiaceae bacterium]